MRGKFTKDYWIIKFSGLFDPVYYLKQYPDVGQADVDPLEHFVLHGWKEGRNPNEWFYTKQYLKNNPDVARAGINPFAHWIRYKSKIQKSSRIVPTYMTIEEADRILKSVKYWHYPFELPWGKTHPNKPGHDIRHYQRWEHFFKPLLNLYEGELAEKSVLDLGCCQGFWTFECVKYGASYCLGIDASEEFIRQAVALKTVLGFERCEFKVCNLEEEQWWRGLPQFDIILVLGLLYHLADPVRFLTKVAELAKEIIVIDTEIYSGNLENLHIMFIIPRDEKEPTTANSNIKIPFRCVLTKNSLNLILSKFGFKVYTLPIRSELPQEYVEGRRISVIATRKQEFKGDII